MRSALKARPDFVPSNIISDFTGNWSVVSILKKFYLFIKNFVTMRVGKLSQRFGDRATGQWRRWTECVVKPKFHYADFATKSGTSSRQRLQPIQFLLQYWL